MERTVSVADLAVTIASARADVGRELALLFDACRTARPSTAVCGAIRWDPARAVRPDRPPDVRSGDGSFWLDGGASVAAQDRGLVGALCGDTISIGGTLPAVNAARSLRTAVQLPLSQLLANCDRHVIHGALVRRGDDAVMIVGRSGSGKSTASFAAATLGWEVLADDMSIIRVADGDVVAWGLPKPLHVPGDLIAELGVDVEPIAGDARARVALPVTGASCDVGSVVVGVVHVAHSATAAAPAATPGPMAWTQTVLASMPLAVTPSGARAVFPAAGALARLPSVELRHDADPARRLEEAARLLDAAVDGFVARRPERDQ